MLLPFSMTKTALSVILAVIGFAAPANAAPHAKVAPAPAKVSKQPKSGDTYVVGHEVGRTALTAAQIDEVMKTRVGDVSACWSGLPAAQRKQDVNAVLSLAIDDGGEVQTVDVAEVPDEVVRCIAKAAVAWTFPQTDPQAEAPSYRYPIVLHAN